MIIHDVPKIFQPKYKSDYPKYSSGKNMEEIFFEFFSVNAKYIVTDLVYLPVFWTSYYVTHKYGDYIQELYDWLNTLDKNKKYFTIIQYASGLYIKNHDLNITIFGAGGGGFNKKGYEQTQVEFSGFRRVVFIGDKPTYDIPLMCLPRFPEQNIKKDIFCSFMGRFDTHPTRTVMKEKLSKFGDKFLFCHSKSFKEYNDILNKSKFSLSPRGYGYTSFRIYEAILANSIPIYIWYDKKVLPFEDIINWEDFCILVHKDDIEKIPSILDSVNYERMYNNLQKVKEKFTFDETFKYICNKIK